MCSASETSPEDPAAFANPLVTPGSFKIAGAEKAYPKFPNRKSVAPWIHGSMPEGIRLKVESGFFIAVQRVQDLPACRRLFDELGANAMDILESGLYLPVGSHLKQKRICSRSKAVSYVGSPTTFVCRDFARMTDARAAMYVIHEALHHAGLGEYPFDVTAPTSREINAMIVHACGF